MIRSIYTLFIGVFLVLFVGVGISAFYPAPKYPDMPASIKYEQLPEAGVKESPKKIAQRKEYDKAQEAFSIKSQKYERNVSMIAVIAAVIFVAASLTLLKTIYLIADGILLGGVLTLLYGTIRGFNTNDTRFLFVVVSVGLAISLLLGYIKFIKPLQGKKK